MKVYFEYFKDIFIENIFSNYLYSSIEYCFLPAQVNPNEKKTYFIEDSKKECIGMVDVENSCEPKCFGIMEWSMFEPINNDNKDAVKKKELFKCNKR